MSWRFRRSIRVLPGIRLNVSKMGTSWSGACGGLDDSSAHPPAHPGGAAERIQVGRSGRREVEQRGQTVNARFGGYREAVYSNVSYPPSTRRRSTLGRTPPIPTITRRYRCCKRFWTRAKSCSLTITCSSNRSRSSGRASASPRPSSWQGTRGCLSSNRSMTICTPQVSASSSGRKKAPPQSRRSRQLPRDEAPRCGDGVCLRPRFHPGGVPNSLRVS